MSARFVQVDACWIGLLALISVSQLLNYVVPTNSSTGCGLCVLLRCVWELMAGQTYAATLSKLTPAEVNAVYDAVDTDEDGSLSPVRALIFTFARLDPHVASLFGRLSVRVFGCLQEELRDA
eukprot:COSAG01_NODE_47281_length_392_cov_0.505119_1_plen_121_part_01